MLQREHLRSPGLAQGHTGGFAIPSIAWLIKGSLIKGRHLPQPSLSSMACGVLLQWVIGTV